MVVCSVLTWLGAWWKGEFGWPSSHWLGHARTLPSAHLKLNIQCKETWRAWHTWRGRGSLPVPPCPPTGSCTNMHYRPTWVWRDVERPRSMTIAISKIKFQTSIFEIICILRNCFHWLLFAYTTSNVYLTLRFKYWNLSIKFSWK